MSTENKNQSAFPVIQTEKKSGVNDWGNTFSTGGLTKREMLAAMAKTPDVIIQQEIDAWKGDRNQLPPVGTPDYEKMLKAIAFIESKYAKYKADELLNELNPTP